MTKVFCDYCRNEMIEGFGLSIYKSGGGPQYHHLDMHDSCFKTMFTKFEIDFDKLEANWND